MRIPEKDIERVGKRTRIYVDGKSIPAYSGESIGSAMLADGHFVMRHTRSGATRGMFCGMGVCFGCSVRVNGVENICACRRQVRTADIIETGRDPGRISDDILKVTEVGSLPVRDSSLQEPDIAVVGGGPAGICAALTASRAGADVVLLDEGQQLGGQFYKQPCKSFQFSPGQLPDKRYLNGRRLISEVLRGRVRVLENAVVWGAFQPKEIVASVGDASLSLNPKKLIIATGAFERVVPMPGWTLPGVMTTGALQILLRSYRVVPGKRVIIAGNGPLNFQVAAELLRAQVQVIALIEASRPNRVRALPALFTTICKGPDLVRDGLGYLFKLASAKVPILYGHAIVAIEGDNRVQNVRVARLDDRGFPMDNTIKSIGADVVGISNGFWSANEISRALGIHHLADEKTPSILPIRNEDLETNIPGVYVVGDAAAPWGARASLAEGFIAGANAAQKLGLKLPKTILVELSYNRRRLAIFRQFQQALRTIYQTPELLLQFCDADTIICRCEEVTYGKIRNLAEQGFTIGNIKRQTRAGMGRCQGRYCSYLIQRILSDIQGTEIDEMSGWALRLPVKPVPISNILKEAGN